jgi:hypothetical protein
LTTLAGDNDGHTLHRNPTSSARQGRTETTKPGKRTCRASEHRGHLAAVTAFWG